jgi:hypothetical protein
MQVDMKWFGNDIMKELAEVERKLTSALARRGAEIAMTIAPRDTEFYANNIHGMAPGGEGVSGSTGQEVNRFGKRTRKRAMPMGALRDRGAIYAAASYSTAVERDHSVLARAVDSLGDEFPSIAASVGAVSRGR